MTPEQEFFSTFDPCAEVTAAFERTCVLMVKYPDAAADLEDIAKRLALLERFLLTAQAMSEQLDLIELDELRVH